MPKKIFVGALPPNNPAGGLRAPPRSPSSIRPPNYFPELAPVSGSDLEPCDVLTCALMS